MGDFRMTVEAVGGHGCDRKAGPGDRLSNCGQEACPDCMFARFVAQLKHSGANIYKATMHHWPGDMVDHTMPLIKGKDGGSGCSRCGRSAEQITTSEEATRATIRAADKVDAYIASLAARWRENMAKDPMAPLASDDVLSVVIGNIRGFAAEMGLTGEKPAPCREYDPAREVIDDYTERHVAHPTGHLTLRATGVRVKGSF